MTGSLVRRLQSWDVNEIVIMHALRRRKDIRYAL